MAIKKIPLRGISRTPSDRMSADGGCAESLNVYLDENELAPMPELEDVTESLGLPEDGAGKAIYIHKTPEYAKYILQNNDEICMYWTVPDGATVNEYGESSVTMYSDRCIINQHPYEPIPKVGDFFVYNSTYYLLSSVSKGSPTLDVTPYTCYWSEVHTLNELVSIYTLQEGEQLKSITSLGNTLMILTNLHTVYALYKNGSYTLLGDRIPVPRIKVEHVNYNSDHSSYGAMKKTIKWQRFGDDYREDYEIFGTVISAQEIRDNETSNARRVNKAWKEMMAELNTIINDSVSHNHNLQALSMPVMIRYAVRLYDGSSYVCHSAPILVDPYDFSKENMLIGGGEVRFSYNNQLSSKDSSLHDSTHTNDIGDMFRPYYLKFSIDDGDEGVFESWRDIVAGVVIFMSPEINRFNLELESIDEQYPGTGGTVTSGISMKPLSIDEQIKGITDASLFYKIKEIGFEDYLTTTEFVFNDFIEYSGDKLTTKERLPDDISESNDMLIPGDIRVFNQRALFGGCQLEHMDGYYQLPSNVPEGSNIGKYRVKYTMESQNGSTYIVWRDYDTTESGEPGPWLFYPNARCRKVDVFYSSDSGETWNITSEAMKEHPGLNGAFVFKGWGAGNPWTGEAIETPDFTTRTREPRPNILYQTKVDNPFAIESEQQFTGKIISTATITKPLSTGQFGYAAMYIFTDNGLWALSTAADGTFSKIDAVSQDIAIEGTVCQLDQVIIFTTKRGVMLLSGSDIKCISEKMNGLHYTLSAVPESLCYDDIWGELAGLISTGGQKTFADFVKKSRTVYDYTNQRLLFFHTPENGAVTDYAYIYMLKTDSWHKMPMPEGYSFENMLNSYPESYISARYDEGNQTYMRVLSCSTVLDPDSNTRHAGIIVTRPLYLDSDDVRKTIKHLFVRGIYEKGNVKYILQGSMDGMNWVMLTSLKGQSYKLYRVVVLSNLLPHERLSYIEVDYEPRFASRIR